MSLRQLLRKPLTTWQELGVILLVFGVWFTIQVLHDWNRASAAMQYELRSCQSGAVGRDLIRTTNSTMLDGTSEEFTADLASILGEERGPWQTGERPRPGDRRGWVRLIITNEQGQALHMLLQDEYASGGWRFRLLSYRKIAQPSGLSQ
jgi:hypothetical protein